MAREDEAMRMIAGQVMIAWHLSGASFQAAAAAFELNRQSRLTFPPLPAWIGSTVTYSR